MRRYGLIFGVELGGGGVGEISGNGSSYVAKGVVNCEWVPDSGEGDPAKDEAELPRLCSLASLESERAVEAGIVVVEVQELIFVSIVRKVARNPFCLFGLSDSGKVPTRDA